MRAHEAALNRPRSAFGGTIVPAGTKVLAISKSSLRALRTALFTSRCTPLERHHAAAVETTAERTMNPAVDHFCLSGLTPCPRLKNGRLIPMARNCDSFGIPKSVKL